MQRQKHWGRRPGLPSVIKVENILDFKLNIGKQQEVAGAQCVIEMQGRTVMPDAAGLKSSHLSGFSRGLKVLKGIAGFPVKNKRVQLDSLLAPTPDTDSGGRYRKHLLLGN